MAQGLTCECSKRYEAIINSQKVFREIKDFFEEQLALGIMIEDDEKEPFYVWKSGEEEVKHYATKWYRCKECGCLWEFKYPDFPTKGFVRKYEKGIYTGKEEIISEY